MPRRIFPLFGGDIKQWAGALVTVLHSIDFEENNGTVALTLGNVPKGWKLCASGEIAQLPMLPSGSTAKWIQKV